MTHTKTAIVAGILLATLSLPVLAAGTGRPLSKTPSQMITNGAANAGDPGQGVRDVAEPVPPDRLDGYLPWDRDETDASNVFRKVASQFLFDQLRMILQDSLCVFMPGGCGTSGPPWADNDNDGVRNIVDQCDNTPRGIQVDRFGCPLSDLTVDAGTPQTVRADQAASLEATANGGRPEYEFFWALVHHQQGDAGAATLAGARGQQTAVSFTLDARGHFLFEVTVIDDEGYVATDTVDVLVVDPNTEFPSDFDDSFFGGGSQIPPPPSTPSDPNAAGS